MGRPFQIDSSKVPLCFFVQILQGTGTQPTGLLCLWKYFIQVLPLDIHLHIRKPVCVLSTNLLCSETSLPTQGGEHLVLGRLLGRLVHYWHRRLPSHTPAFILSTIRLMS